MKKLMIIALIAVFTVGCTNSGIEDDLIELGIEPEKVDLGNGDKSNEEDEDEGV